MGYKGLFDKKIEITIVMICTAMIKHTPPYRFIASDQVCFKFLFKSDKVNQSKFLNVNLFKQLY